MLTTDDIWLMGGDVLSKQTFSSGDVEHKVILKFSIKNIKKVNEFLQQKLLMSFLKNTTHHDKYTKITLNYLKTIKKNNDYILKLSFLLNGKNLALKQLIAKCLVIIFRYIMHNVDDLVLVFRTSMLTKYLEKANAKEHIHIGI